MGEERRGSSTSRPIPEAIAVVQTRDLFSDGSSVEHWYFYNMFKGIQSGGTREDGKKEREEKNLWTQTPNN